MDKEKKMSYFGSGDSLWIEKYNSVMSLTRYSRHTNRVLVQPKPVQVPGLQLTGNVSCSTARRKYSSSLKTLDKNLPAEVSVDLTTAAEDKQGDGPNDRKSTATSPVEEKLSGSSIQHTLMMSVQTAKESCRQTELNLQNRYRSSDTPILSRYAAGTPSPRMYGDVVMFDLDESDDATLPNSSYKVSGHTNLVQGRNSKPTTGIRHLMSIRNKELMVTAVHDGRETACSTETDDTIAMSVSIVFDEKVKVKGPESVRDTKFRKQPATQRIIGQLRKCYNYLKKKVTVRSFVVCGRKG